MVRQLWQDQSGLTTVEYALLLVLVAVASLSAWTVLGLATHDSVTASIAALPVGQ